MDWTELTKQLVLADQRISEQESELIQEAVRKRGVVDRATLEFLVDLKKKAKMVHPSFDEFFFTILKKKVLADGVIRDDEACWLRQLIFNDNTAGAIEVQFLKQLKSEARSTGEEFQKLYRECTRLSSNVFHG